MPDVLSGTAPYKTDSCNFFKTQNAFFDNCDSVEVSIFLRKKKMFILMSQKVSTVQVIQKVEILA